MNHPSEPALHLEPFDSVRYEVEPSRHPFALLLPGKLLVGTGHPPIGGDELDEASDDLAYQLIDSLPAR